MRLRHRLLSAALAVGLGGATAVTTSGPAQAAFPGSNGRIAYEVAGVIYTVDAAGNDPRELTTGVDNHGPNYSPDGKTIVFSKGGDIWTMTSYGRRSQRMTSGAALDVDPSWAPDGRRFVFSRRASAGADFTLFVFDTRSGSVTRLANSPDGCAVAPTWSADNLFVVYWDQCSDDSGNQALKKVRVRDGSTTAIFGTGGSVVQGRNVQF